MNVSHLLSEHDTRTFSTISVFFSISSSVARVFGAVDLEGEVLVTMLEERSISLKALRRFVRTAALLLWTTWISASSTGLIAGQSYPIQSALLVIDFSLICRVSSLLEELIEPAVGCSHLQGSIA